MQDFIPAPLDIATSMYYTGLDPFTLKPVFIAKALRDRKSQRALMQFFKPENYFEVRDALRSVNRNDLIGEGCDCLIPSRPPKEAMERRREDANKRFRGEYVHTIPNPSAQPTETSQPAETNQTVGSNSDSVSAKPLEEQRRKGPKKQQRGISKVGGKKPNTGYRPGRRV